MIPIGGMSAGTGLSLLDATKDKSLSLIRNSAQHERAITQFRELCFELDIPCSERDLSLTEAYRCDEAFCTGTMGELVPVVRLDDRPLGGLGRPVTERLHAAFRDLTVASGTRLVDPLADD